MGTPDAKISLRRDETHLFDDRPIPLSGFRLHARKVEAVGRPSIGEWMAALDFAVGTETASPFWIGQLWNYGESRKDWRDKLDQALADMGRPLVRKTLVNYGYVDRSLSDEAKALAPSISHASVVAGLEHDEQEELLEKARTEELSVRELSHAVKSVRSRKVIDGQAKTMHTVEVTVRLSCEAESEYQAEQLAWSKVKMAIHGIGHAHVIAAHARPYIQAVRHRKGG